MNRFSWVGSQHDFVDEKDVRVIDRVTLGRFGGNSSAGQTKNEDGCVIWVGEEWEFAAILDAHYSADSAELVIDTLNQQMDVFVGILNMTGIAAFKLIESKLLEVFQDNHFLNKCKKVKGETACLICVRKENFLWWFSVGDCVVYAFHPDFTRLQQFQLNQRQFFEWIGQVNTFDKSVPCFSSGVRELRKGTNLFFMTTDGLLECPGEPFTNPLELEKVLQAENLGVALNLLLNEIEENNVRDSTTMIAWSVNNTKQGSLPSDLVENR